MMTYLLLLAGLAGLLIGGETLVRGATGLALRFGISPLVIGLTIVGFGTSSPELLVSLNAALAGQPGIAVGNVVGSNIANILLILGLASLVRPIATSFASLRRDIIWLSAVALALPLIMLPDTIGRMTGLALVTALAIYLWICLNSDTAPEDAPDPSPLWQSLLFLIGGLVAVVIGAQALIDAATVIARNFGVSEAVIGLTIVAVGTSLPELATSLVAAWRGQQDIAIGNIIGSNIFNVLGILGVTALVIPIPRDDRFLMLDAPVALAATALLVFMVMYFRGINRLAGMAMVAAYTVYILVTATT